MATSVASMQKADEEEGKLHSRSASVNATATDIVSALSDPKAPKTVITLNSLQCTSKTLDPLNPKP